MSKNGKKKKKEAELAQFNNFAPIEKSDGTKPFLNQRHELFCVLYAGVGTRHFFNNAQNSYIEAYAYGQEHYELETRLVLEQNTAKRKKMSQRKKSIELVARVEGSRLLANPNIRARVNYLLNKFIENEVVDRELAKVIIQDIDLKSKVDAIKEFNRVRDRVKDKLEGKVQFSWLATEPPSSKQHGTAKPKGK